MILPRIALAFALLAAAPASAAGLTVRGLEIAGTNASLILPAKPRGAIILMSGGEGRLGIGADGSISSTRNQLVRTREAYAARGFAVLVPEGSVDLAAAVAAMSTYGKVTVVATSRGTLRAAQGIAAGARPARLVLTSGLLSPASGSAENVARILGSPSALPPTLIIHHRHDGCHVTRPDGVEPFLAWAGGRARVTWLDGGTTEGSWCEAWAHHGFNGQDGDVVAAATGFAAR